MGGSLALVALALQLILSFGHVHVGGIYRATGVAHAAAPTQPLSPRHQPANDADDYCAICATIHLAANSFLPAPPQLPTPPASGLLEHRVSAALAFIALRRTAFQSRAPPLV